MRYENKDLIAEKRQEGLIAAGALAFIVGVCLLIFFVTPNDHDAYCESEADRPHSLPYFRPIESRSFGGTPAGSTFTRLGPYNDDWITTPHPKEISAGICDDDIPFNDVPQHRRVTNMVWAWGQFFVHGLDSTVDLSDQPRVFVRPGEFIGIRPSQFRLDDRGRKQQINLLAPYIDASVVYGHTSQIESTIRTSGGKVRMSSSPHHDELMLPINATTNNFFSGDFRTNENVLLSSIHTIWNREHNYWARKLKEENPHWTSQHVYNMARTIVIGEMQAIHYREWLPSVLGTRDLFGREPCRRSDLKATIFNEFATAAFRLGHTLVTETLEARDMITGEVDPLKSLTLFAAFDQTSVGGSIWNHGVDTYVYGAILQEANQLDSKITNALRESIFDLPAMNIARGRNHRIASYQQLYKMVTGTDFVSYSQLSSSPDVQNAFQEIYGDARDSQIDPWVAIISEDNTQESMLGRVGSWIIAEQFARLRDADPYFYLWDEAALPYRAQIHNTRFSDVIRRTTRISWGDLPPNVFVI